MSLIRANSKSRKTIKVRSSLLFNELGEVRVGVNDGLNKIRLETNADIRCINKKNNSNQQLESVMTGLEINCSETSLEMVKAKCFGLLDVSVIFPID